MKRLTFQCTISSVDDLEWRTPEQFVNMALIHGDKHQDFFMYPSGEIKVEEYEEG
ncbi:hypothetical protein OV320_7810 [Actinobacteria bacterium OV320]|jgi:hypothetical protein|nr:hypothetical protein OV320_7810 [Actinobacteria bacterium OV320]